MGAFVTQQPSVFTRDGIEALSPNQPGVYGLYRGDRWVYVGQSEDVRRRLLEHLGGDNSCITGSWPSHFVAELVHGGHAAREARERVLINECQPLCNVA